MKGYKGLVVHPPGSKKQEHLACSGLSGWIRATSLYKWAGKMVLRTENNFKRIFKLLLWSGAFKCCCRLWFWWILSWNITWQHFIFGEKTRVNLQAVNIQESYKLGQCIHHNMERVCWVSLNWVVSYFFLKEIQFPSVRFIEQHYVWANVIKLL